MDESIAAPYGTNGYRELSEFYFSGGITAKLISKDPFMNWSAAWDYCLRPTLFPPTIDKFRAQLARDLIFSK